jgi:hypothetical protein
LHELSEPIVEPIWIDVQSRSCKLYNYKVAESVMVEFTANDSIYRMWLSILNAKQRPDKFWRDHAGNEPPPADVTEFLNRAGELRQTAQIMIRPKGKYFEIVGIKVRPERRKPVPIPGRISNAELQQEIDATKRMLPSLQ